jgi:hypothetical protein
LNAAVQRTGFLTAYALAVAEENAGRRHCGHSPDLRLKRHFGSRAL